MVLRGRVLRTEDAGTGCRTDTICVDVVADTSLAENFKKAPQNIPVLLLE